MNKTVRMVIIIAIILGSIKGFSLYLKREEKLQLKKQISDLEEEIYRLKLNKHE